MTIDKSSLNMVGYGCGNPRWVN